MKKIIQYLTYMPLLAGAIACFTACNHKELCYNHDEHSSSKLLIKADYELEWCYLHDHEHAIDWANNWPDHFTDYHSLCPHVPAGLRMVVYKDGESHDMHNLPATGGEINMNEGTYSLLFYNNDTEYIVFDDLTTYASAKASTRKRTRSTYMGNPYAAEDGGTNTVNPPDVLFGNYVEAYEMRNSAEAQVLEVTKRPLVYTYKIRYEFDSGLEYVALARGALSGMADGVYLNSGVTSENKATVLFEDECEINGFGVRAIVRSFGAAGHSKDFYNSSYTKGDPHSHGLNLEVRLKNGNIKSFDFDVTDQIDAQPYGGVIIVSGITITDEEGKAGGSGFDVDVDDWGEYEDIELPLK